MRTLLLLCLAATISAGKSWAQLLPVGIAGEDLLRLSSLLDSERVTSFLLRPLRIAPVPPGDLSLRTACAVTCLTPLRLRVFHNSGFPVVANDGAVWQGRGLTAALDAGFTFRRRGLELAALPTLVWAQNRSFALRDVSRPGRTVYANPWHPRNGTGGWIDLPQRFGPDALARLDPGHSYAAVSWRALRVSAGTTNLWWGPGRHNAIIISNQAPGFPHVSLSTARPIDVGIGRLEVQWLWGRPRDSRWSDSIPTDSARFFTGMAWTLAPDLFPGLWIGAARVFHLYVPPGGLSLGDYALVFQGITKVSQADSSNPTGDDDRDQLAALFMRWAPPGSGFEAYAEWARNDHNWDLRDFLLEPEHSQAYTLGLQAVRRLDRGRVLRIGAELTHLERSATLQVRATPTYYTHHIVRSGYTNRGEVIGAVVGPGGNGQYLDVDVFTPRGRLGLFVSRVVRDNDAYYANRGGETFRGHDVTLTTGLVIARQRDPWRMEVRLARMRDYNRYFMVRNDVTNWHVALDLVWLP